MDKLRWGVLSTAKIARTKVIPALQKGRFTQVTALASRNLADARAAAAELGLPKAYGSYEELLADPDVDAIYNPLPNHLHVDWSIKALEAGKHVLCEKPVGLDVADAKRLLAAAEARPHLKAMEAFMYRFHPQWVRAKALVASGALGEVRTIQSAFSYFNDDPANIRNRREWGGGALMDIGCYCVSLARFLYGSEPLEVRAQLERDPAFGTDRLVSGLLEFAGGSASFTCGTQMAPYQRVHVFGTKARLEIEIPFNAPPDKPCRLWVVAGGKLEEEVFEVCDQYTLQGDAFARAVFDRTPTPTPLSDAVANMAVIEALFASAGK